VEGRCLEAVKGDGRLQKELLPEKFFIQDTAVHCRLISLGLSLVGYRVYFHKTLAEKYEVQMCHDVLICTN